MGDQGGRTASLVTAIALFVAAVVVRLPGISDDGLLFDDAWVAIGGMEGSIGELLTVSTMHPGFTAGLMGWSVLTPATTTWISVPGFLVGAATPTIAFLLFRRLRIQYWVSLAVGLLVLFAPTHIVYSGRVKPYMVETVAILLLGAVLGRVARLRWTLGTAALWATAGFLFATINAFAFVAAAVAAGILVLHPRGDWPWRLGATAVQGVLQLVYLGSVQRSFDSEGLESGWGDVFDGYVELDRDPADMAHELGTHLARVGQVVVEDRWLALGLVLVAAAGLAWRAWRGPYQVMARFLLALPVVALVGSLLDRLPFGTIVATPVYPGTRASLWLLPSVLAGVAFAVDDVDRALARRAPVARWATVAGVGAVVVAVAAGGVSYDADYPAPGSETAHAVVADGATEDQLVLVLDNGRWSYAAVPDVGIDLEALPDTIVGYEPVFTDPGVERAALAAAWPGSAAQQRLEDGDVDRVVIVNTFPGVFDDVVPVVRAELGELGFEVTRHESAGTTDVEVWEPSG
jgi:hypothetical protein